MLQWRWSRDELQQRGFSLYDSRRPQQTQSGTEEGSAVGDHHRRPWAHLGGGLQRGEGGCCHQQRLGLRSCASEQACVRQDGAEPAGEGSPPQHGRRPERTASHRQQKEIMECQQPGRQRRRPQWSVQRGTVQLQQRKYWRAADSQKPAVEGGRSPGQLPVNSLWGLHQWIRRWRHLRPPIQRREAGEGRRWRWVRLRLSGKIRRRLRPRRPRRRPRWRIRRQVLNPAHGLGTMHRAASILHLCYFDLQLLSILA